MDNTRQQRIAQLIRKELGDLFLVDGKNVYNCMITVTKTTVSKDFSIARSYLSVYNAKNQNGVIEAIRANTKNIRFRIGQKLKKQLRVIPELSFFIDDSLDYIENIEKLLKE